MHLAAPAALLLVLSKNPVKKEAPGRGSKKIIVSAPCIAALNCRRWDLSWLPNWKLSQYINMHIYLYCWVFVLIYLAELPPWLHGHRHKPQPSRRRRSPRFKSLSARTTARKVSGTYGGSGSRVPKNLCGKTISPCFLLRHPPEIPMDSDWRPARADPWLLHHFYGHFN